MFEQSQMASNKRRIAPITVYTNGNKYDSKRFIFNPKYVRTFDALLDQLTVQTNATRAVRRIYTPQGSRQVGNLSAIQPGASYVAVSHGRFKKMPYGKRTIGTSSEGTTTTKTSRRLKATSSRLQRSYEDQMKTQKTIYVHRNGYNEAPTAIFVTKKLLRNISQVLDFLQEKLICERAIVSLHKLNGLTIDEVSKLQPEGRYVVVEQGQRFKHIAYEQADVEVTSPRKHKLPEIKNPGFNTWRSEGKTRHRLPSNESSQEENTKVKPKLKLPHIKQSVNDFDVVYGYPKKGGNAVKITYRSQYAQESTRNTPGNTHQGIFYATGAQRLNATEIRDDKRVRVDKPVDMMKAQQVEEKLDGVDYHDHGRYTRRDPPEKRPQVKTDTKESRQAVTLPQISHVPKPPPKDTFPTKPSIVHPRKHAYDKHKRSEKAKDSDKTTIPKSLVKDQRYVSQDNSIANTKRYIVTREQQLFDMHGRDGREPAKDVVHVYVADARSKGLERKSVELEKRKRIEHWVDQTVEEKQREDEIAAVAKQLVLNALSNVARTVEMSDSKNSYPKSSNKNGPNFCDDDKNSGVKYHRVFGQ